MSVGDGKGIFCSISQGLLGSESYHVLARKVVVDTTNNSEVFTKLCGVMYAESLQCPLTYCFRFQSLFCQPQLAMLTQEPTQIFLNF